jgi:hypothetical protein
MTKALFTGIQDRLIAQVTELKLIDFDLGQLEQEELPPLDYPAALIGFTDSEVTELGGRSQQAETTVQVRLVFRVFERTSSIVAGQYRAVGLAHLDLVEKVKWALHGLAGTDFSALSHRNFRTEPRADLRVYSLDFSARVCLDPPSDQVQYVPWGSAGGSGAGPEFCVEDQNAT